MGEIRGNVQPFEETDGGVPLTAEMQ